MFSQVIFLLYVGGFMSFVVGDVVYLKSTGPAMTVVAINDNDMNPIKCSWFEGDVLKTGNFPQEALEPFDDELAPTAFRG
ncbi:YodC family protein [Aeromonas veronii]|uniref:YodC family protein n=1 Tax=Aeromonas veronii TaxID=654 RepID=UPI003D1C3B0C